MKMSCAFALLACVAAAAATASSSSEGQKSESQKSSAGVVPSPYYPAPPSSVQYPVHDLRLAAEYNGPFVAKSAFAPKAADFAPPSPYYGAYQPYQQQQQQQQPYNGFGSPYQQQYFPASAYAAYPYAVQPFNHGYPPYPVAYQPYGGQHAAGPSQPPSSFHNVENHLRRYQEQPYQSAVPQYQPFYPNPPKTAADPVKDDRE